MLACWTTLVSTPLPPWALTMINPAAPCSVSESAMSVTIAASVVAAMLMVPGNAACSCEQPSVVSGD